MSNTKRMSRERLMFLTTCHHLVGLVMKREGLTKRDAIGKICEMLGGRPKSRAFYLWLRGKTPWRIDVEKQRLEDLAAKFEKRHEEVTIDQMKVLERVISGILKSRNARRSTP